MTFSTDTLFVCEHAGVYRCATAAEITSAALKQIQRDLSALPLMNSPDLVRHFLQLRIGSLAYEVFFVMFLDPHNRLLAFEEMFRGTLNQTAVYPREVVKRALELNAGGVILSHNHPGGSTRPSQADLHLTRTLRDALALVDLTVLDHIIVSTNQFTSLAQVGLL